MSAQAKIDSTVLAERSVLGSLLLDKRARAKVNGLSPGDFGSESNRIIFAAIIDEFDETGTADTVTVFERLQRNGQADRVGGLAYLNSLPENTLSAANIERHVYFVHKAGRQRKRIALYTEAIAAANKGDADSEAAILRTLDPRWTDAGVARPGELRFRLKSVAEVSSAEPATWLVRDLIPARGLMVLYGAPGSGKSFVGFDLAAHLVRKLPWLNRRVRASRVIYVALEGAMVERLAAYKKHHVLSDADLEGLSIVERVSLDLRNSVDVAQLISDIRAQLGDYSGHLLILIDTFARATPGAKENASEDMGAAIAAAESIGAALGATIGLIHHSGKDATRGARGWSGLFGACDVEMQCERTEDRRILTFTKVKDGEDGVAFDFKLQIVDIGPRDAVDPDAGPDERRTSCVAMIVGDAADRVREPPAKARGKHQRVLLDALSANGPWTRDQAHEFMAQAGIARGRRKEAIESLLVAGVIEDTVVGLRCKQ